MLGFSEKTNVSSPIRLYFANFVEMCSVFLNSRASLNEHGMEANDVRKCDMASTKSKGSPSMAYPPCIRIMSPGLRDAPASPQKTTWMLPDLSAAMYVVIRLFSCVRRGSSTVTVIAEQKEVRLEEAINTTKTLDSWTWLQKDEGAKKG